MANPTKAEMIDKVTEEVDERSRSYSMDSERGQLDVSELPKRLRAKIALKENAESAQIQRVFAQKLLEAPPKDKAEAERASLIAEALEALAAADKTRYEIDDAQSPTSKVLKGLAVLSGIVGAVLLVGSVMGFVDLESKKEKFEAEKANAQKLLDEAQDIKKREAEMEKKAEFLTRQTTLEERIRKYQEEQNQVLAKELESKERALKSSTDAVAEKQKQLVERTEKLSDAEKDLEERTTQLESTKKDLAEAEKELQSRKAELENQKELLKPVQEELTKVKLALANVDDSGNKSNPPAQQLKYQLQIAELKKPKSQTREEIDARVKQLFDAEGKVRGEAYRVLTTSKTRENPELLESLLKEGEARRKELEQLEAANNSANAVRISQLRRGLENVLVTLRDMSRQVTKIPEPNRARVLEFADKLVDVGYGTKEEAVSLRNWLTNGTY